MSKTVITTRKCRLIAAVRAHKLLYDPSQPGYADQKERGKIWAEVATECGINSGSAAKLIWKKLRDSYRSYRRNINKDPDSPISMFFTLMKFIDPYMVGRSVDQSMDRTADSTMDNTLDGTLDNTLDGMCPSQESQPPVAFGWTNNNLEEETNSNINTEQTTNSEPLSIPGAPVGEFTTIQYWNDPEDNPRPILPLPMLQTNFVVKSANPPPTNNGTQSLLRSNSDSEIEMFEDILPPALNNVNSENNSLKLFFDAMYASASNLPRSLQRTVKTKIFAAILDAEEECDNNMRQAAAVNATHVKREL